MNINDPRPGEVLSVLTFPKQGPKSVTARALANGDFRLTNRLSEWETMNRRFNQQEIEALAAELKTASKTPMGTLAHHRANIVTSYLTHNSSRICVFEFQVPADSSDTNNVATWRQVPQLQAGATFAFAVSLDHEKQVELAKKRVEQTIPKRWITPVQAEDAERPSDDDSEEDEVVGEADDD